MANYAVGLMSGTSLDGVDVALVEIEGVSLETKVRLIDFITVPFSKEMKNRIEKSLSVDESSNVLLCSLNFELGEVFGEAVLKICEKNKLMSSDLLFVASHGQTIYHIPNGLEDYVASTLQLGESSIIAEKTKTTVISDFRYRDMAVGGQGAPIVPYSEIVLYQMPNVTRILQNIGGIGNATILPATENEQAIIAFDTGPGNMIIDELCRHFYQVEYDKDGQYAADGVVDEMVLAKMMSHPYLKKDFPKTTGREDFGREYTAQLIEAYDLSANDWIRTATLFTAKSIAEALAPFISGKTELIIGGGGSYNKVLVAMIKENLPEVAVKTQEDLGNSSEAKEAIAMVILGNQTYHHLPSNVPSATGAAKEVILGKITYYV
ncbi:anhydro-N-acetylmuramic acid kinase [Enterococcus sp. JM4C]|uniref:anhydro-N-acetylmuramic acid kinase AnmK n=1 Tax=Candidatus Enterococcus huntleyi TaxID=1857217 RepID=UPI001379A28D|nr:anhydro-N-acetylmuramic acid kinase AnmK [Enterococcus sp. JM4C]KAF1297376.1 anhydro-N-acetylmuramic acid kinase [Enterococcus sp. JM4C]